jgi:hypothetical protein
MGQNFCGEERPRLNKKKKMIKQFSFSGKRRKRKKNIKEDQSYDQNDRDMVDIIMQMCFDAANFVPEPQKYMQSPNLMTTDFALYQLKIGQRKQDQDWVPGAAIYKLLKKYFVPSIFPEDMPLDRFVAKLCWFAGEQRSISTYEQIILMRLENGGGYDNTNTFKIGANDEEDNGKDKMNVEEERKIEDIDENLLLDKLSNSEKLFVESLPIKRFLSSLVLMSAIHHEKKLMCLELIDRPNILYSLGTNNQTFRTCRSTNCIYKQFVKCSSLSSKACLYYPPTKSTKNKSGSYTKESSSTIASQDRGIPTNTGTCTCPHIKHLRKMEDLFTRSWSMSYRIQLALSADDDHPWADGEEYDDDDDKCFHVVMRHHKWRLQNGIYVSRNELPDLLHQSNEYKSLVQCFSVTPHIYNASGGTSKLPSMMSKKNQINSAKDKLRRETMLSNEMNQKRRGGQMGHQLGGNIKNQPITLHDSIHIVEAQLITRTLNWSMSYEMNEDIKNSIENRYHLTKVIATNKDLLNTFGSRSHDRFSEWKSLLLHGLDTIKIEYEKVRSTSLSEYEKLVILTASENWLDEITFCIEWSHIALNVATKLLTSPLTFDDMHYQHSVYKATKNVNMNSTDDTTTINATNGYYEKSGSKYLRKETNPWRAIRNNDIVSLAILLQHGIGITFDLICDRDPDTGYSPLETAALSGHYHILYLLIRRSGIHGAMMNHSKLSECAIRSGSLITVQMCMQYSNHFSLIYVYRYRNAYRKEGEDNEDYKNNLMSLASLIFCSYDEINWRTDLLKCIHGTSEIDNLYSTYATSSSKYSIGHAPLPPLKGDITNELINDTMTKRHNDSITHIMNICCAKDYTEGNNVNERNKTALTLIIFSAELLNNLILLNAVISGIWSVSYLTGCESIFSDMLKESIKRKAFDVYVICHLIIQKMHTNTNSNTASLPELNHNDYMSKKMMIKNIGERWSLSLIGQVNYDKYIQNDDLKAFLRSPEHPISLTDSTEKQKNDMVERKREVYEYENEIADFSSMVQYCEEITLRCIRLLNRQKVMKEKEKDDTVDPKNDNEKNLAKDHAGGDEKKDENADTINSEDLDDWGDWWVASE